MDSKKNNLFDLDIILILLTILVLCWFIQLIFGRSLGLNEFNFTPIILIGGFLIKIYGRVER